MMYCDISVNGYHIMDAEDEVLLYAENFKNKNIPEYVLNTVDKMLAGDENLVEVAFDEVLYTTVMWNWYFPSLAFKIDACDGPYEYEIFVYDGKITDFREEFVDDNDEGLDYEQLNEDYVREEFEEYTDMVRGE